MYVTRGRGGGVVMGTNGTGDRGSKANTSAREVARGHEINEMTLLYDFGTFEPAFGLYWLRTLALAVLLRVYNEI
jgi:hypothetical protein